MTKTTLKKTFEVAVLATAAAFVATPAQAQPATQPRVVEVTASPDGLVAPGVATLRPGATTFRVTTPDSKSRYVAVVGLRPGGALDTFLDNMTTVLFSGDEEAKRQAGAQVARDLTRHGGVAVNARAAQAVTVLLPPGTYFLVDYTSLSRPNPSGHWHRIAVSGEWSARVASPDHVVLMTEREPGRPRYVAPSVIAPRSTQLVVNTADVLHEAVYVPVLPGTTDADIDRAFAGQGPSPFIEAPPQGVLPIVGNQAVVLHLDLAPGRYAITSWVGHPETGAPDVARGMHKVIDVS